LATGDWRLQAIDGLSIGNVDCGLRLTIVDWNADRQSSIQSPIANSIVNRKFQSSIGDRL
jgi:hypothetical protein